MKILRSIKLITLAGTALLLAACSKPVSIPQTSYGVISSSDSGQIQWDKIYKNQNMLLSELCTKKCDKGYVFDLPLYADDYKGNYTMPRSNGMELGLDVRLTFVFNRDGGKDAIKERLKLITNKYQAKVAGSPSSNQLFYWTIKDIAKFDIPVSKFRSIVRPILAPHEIIDAHSDIASTGEIAVSIEKGVRQHLADNNSVLKLARIEFSKISLPVEVQKKNTQEFNLDAQERIQEQQLKMKRKRVKETHLLNLEELQNDAELIMLIKPMLSNEVLAYKWIQAFNHSVEQGIPVAITPEMLAPAVGKAIDQSFDMSKLMETLKNRKLQIENEIKIEQNCAETTDGCDIK